MSEHTPGPWILREDSCVIVDSVVGYSIAGTRTKRPVEENAANAILISAAPDLLEALERLSAQCDRMRMPGQPMSDAEKAARAAISKAKGQS